jgi:hypothetical protein
MLGFHKDGLLERLAQLDEDADLLFDDDRRFRLVIVGGSALILLETILRATHDIDALEASSEIVHLLERYDINTRVATFINNFPYNYEDRLVLLKKGSRIDFYTASLEDIVVAKLYSARPSDRQDVIDPGVLNALDWEVLEHLALAEDEARASALNDRSYAEFKASYDEYVRRFRPCENSHSEDS